MGPTDYSPMANIMEWISLYWVNGKRNSHWSCF